MRRPLSLALTLVCTAALTACGGGSVDAPTTTVAEAPVAQAAEVITVEAQPSFHAAALQLEAPDNAEQPHRQTQPRALASLATRGLTAAGVEDALRPRALAGSEVQPLAASSTVVTYTPAQIRAAYGLPALPALGTALSAAQAAALGAGQTIYIVNAKHNPNVVAELAAFNKAFGLAGCSSRVLAPGARLGTAPSSCELVVAYTTAAGAVTTTAPAYDSGWATEIALDVQWAHATAPLARLVLIEAPDASVTSLANAVKLANTLGAGVVSMSFGANEGSWTPQVDAAFTGAGMSYLAATGDNGAGVSWPSVSTKVLAVGGTTLNYSTTSRSEVAWTGTGGGISAYVATPIYQSTALTGGARRAVADVAFNADPATGQYVATIAPGSSTVKWLSAGGTSLSTPQWAGLLAIVNAQRVLAGKALVGAPHALLYGQIGTSAGRYSTSFYDVASGSNGSCSSCTARTSYDTPTGWGTPKVAGLLSTLASLK